MAFTNAQFTTPVSASGIVSPDFEGDWSVSATGTLNATITLAANGNITGTWTFSGSGTAVPSHPDFTTKNSTLTHSGTVGGTAESLFFGSSSFGAFQATGVFDAVNNDILLDAMIFVPGQFDFLGVPADLSLHVPGTPILPPIVSIDTYTGSVEEGADSITVTLKRSGSHLELVSTVTLITEDGSAGALDVEPQSITVVFGSGETTKTIQLSGITIDDLLPESTETFGIRLINPDQASLGFSTGSISILDNDTGIVTVGTDGADGLQGGPGPDTLMGGAGNDIVVGGKGNDELRGGSGSDTVTGGDGFDLLVGATGNDSLQGNDNGDVLQGGAGNDWIGGGKGHDAALGGEGNDTLVGGLGQDTLDGGNGDDRFEGAAGNDLFTGGGGNDFVSADEGDDDLFGNLGADTLLGGGGDDDVFGGQDGDSLQGGAGNDELLGAFGNDTVAGDAGTDTLFGGLGNDYLAGGDGNDLLRGAAGADTLAGGAGVDTLDLSEDSLSGGADVVLYETTDGTYTFVSVIVDDVIGFIPGEDLIAFGGAAGVALDDMVVDGSLEFATGAANIDTTHEAIFRAGFADADLTDPSLANLLNVLHSIGAVASIGADALLVIQAETKTGFYHYGEVNTNAQTNIGLAEIHLIGIVEGQLEMSDFGVF